MSWLQEHREQRQREYDDALAPARDWAYHIFTWLLLTMVIAYTALITIGLHGMFKPYDDAIVTALIFTLFVGSQVTWLTGRHAKGTDTHWDYIKRALKYQLVSLTVVFSASFVLLYFFILNGGT